MSNRLKFYREQMAAFEGTVDPQKAIDSGYYVPEPRKSASSLISRLALRPTTTHLLIGGIGSGKTTQLLVCQEQLNKIENTSAHYIDISKFTDISSISSGSIIAIIGLVLSELTAFHNNNQETKEYHYLINRKAHGYSDYEEHVDLDSFNMVWRKGVLEKNSSDKSDCGELIEAVIYLKNLLEEEIIFLIDGLDRLEKEQVFLQIIMSDIQAISDAGIGIILVGPLVAAYSNQRDIIQPLVNYTVYQSCFDVDRDPEAHSFFEQILTIRAKDNFINSESLQNLIFFSGGVLRDLINLTQSSIEESYISDSEDLNVTHVSAAAYSLGRAKLLGMSSGDIDILKNVSDADRFLPRTDEEIRLLVTGRILEYHYPKRRFVVHPTIQPLIG